jgi:two-component system, cell cycle response regulator
MATNSKKKDFDEFTSSATRIGGENLRTLSNEGTDITDTKKFELVPVFNVVSGPEKGRVISLSGRMIVGRSKNCEIPISDPSCSRQHALFEVNAGKVFVEDLKSTNGVKVNGVRIIAKYELSEGDRVQLGDLTIVRFGYMPRAEANIQQDFYQRATRDGLTNSYNRKSFEEAFDREVAHCIRNKRGMGLLMFDIDHFKKINDTHGHAAGDEVLKKVAEAVQGLIRAEDFFARIGGEEFALLTRNEGLDSLKILGERIRALIEELSIETDGKTLKVSISVGVSFMGEEGQPLEKKTLYSQADSALYKAKNSGRNKVCCFEGA